MSYQDFTSLPPDQEREFIPFEHRTRAAAKSAWAVAAICAGAIFLLGMFLFFGYEKSVNSHVQDLENGAAGADSLKKESEPPKRTQPNAAQPDQDKSEPAAEGEGKEPAAAPGHKAAPPPAAPAQGASSAKPGARKDAKGR
jgi:hypothetical protein